jgi:predicted Rossmann fold flavoprotein
VKISGGGRCNVTHACTDPKRLAAHYPRGGQALLGPFHRFQPRDTIEWFETRGVKLKTEPDGRIFPMTDLSQTVIDALTGAARKAGVTVRTGIAIGSIGRNAGGRFEIAMKNGESLLADRLLLATGGNPQGWEWAKALGHTVEPPVPSLFTLTVPGKRLEGLSGISVERARLRVEKTRLEQTGSLLITHWGLSGPAVLKLSAWGARVLHGLNYQVRVRVNWLDIKEEAAQRTLTDWKAVHPRQTVAAHPPFPLPRRLWERLTFLSGLPEDRRWADATRPELRALAAELTDGAFDVRGKSAFKEEFVTCGGVRRDEVDFRTMESRVCPGLFFAGEILDVDGVTGGFNFQSAWTTGWIAGKAMGKAGPAGG